MKKALTIIGLIIIIILIGVIIKNNIATSQIGYKLENVEKYNYVKYKDNDKYGVMNRNGNKIIEAKYEKIEIPNPEKDIFICYESQEKSNVLNEKNEVLFDKYNKVEPIKLKNITSILCYEKSILKYENDGKYGLIDFNGKEVAKNEYDEIENLLGTEGKFTVKKDGKIGIINLNGTTIVKPEYNKIETDNYYNEETKYEKSGYIVSNITNEGYRHGYKNYKGDTILNTEYNDIIRITDLDEEYLIASKNGKYGLYKQKKELIKPEYQSISYTDNGAIIIEKNKQYGIATINGHIKTGTIYEQIEAEGIYLYAQNAKENAVYSSEGEKVDISYDKAIYTTENQNYNISSIINNNVIYYGIESKDGKTLVDPGYSYLEYIYKDYFLVEDEDEKYGVINANGKKEIQLEYDLIQKIKDKNILQALSKDSNDVIFFSTNLEKVATIKCPKIENNVNYIKIYNDKETIYLDKDGNKIKENSEIIEDEKSKELPETIGEYKKFQYSLDDVYYTK